MMTGALSSTAGGHVSKDRSRPYQSEPSTTWLKIKNPESPGVRRFRRPHLACAGRTPCLAFTSAAATGRDLPPSMTEQTDGGWKFGKRVADA
jgi:hypothetical protein